MTASSETNRKRMHPDGTTQLDEDSDVVDVTHVSHQEVHRSRRARRRVSSNSDVPLVTRGSRFAVLTESDDESDGEPSIHPAGQTRNEDDVNTVPASSGAVAAHLGALVRIDADAGQVEFDMTLMDADTERFSTHSAGEVEHQVQVNTSSRIRHSNEQVSQVTHREVRAAPMWWKIWTEDWISASGKGHPWNSASPVVPVECSFVLGGSQRFTNLPCAGVDHGGSITDHPTTPFPPRTDQSARSDTCHGTTSVPGHWRRCSIERALRTRG